MRRRASASAGEPRGTHPGPRMNTAPSGFNPAEDLPAGFLEFYLPLHRRFTPRQQALAARRRAVLAAAHEGRMPGYLPDSEANLGAWKVDLPDWCADQRNQMTGPADDAELVVKMLNSGAPGVMLDLEDSVANTWEHVTRGIENILSALRGSLAYRDRKRGRTVSLSPGSTVIFSRPRGLHLSQAGVLGIEVTSASLFDVAMIAHGVQPGDLKHPLCFYIPKSENADEAPWWRDVFQAIARERSWPADSIKCMALIESHPIAYQVEEFAHHLRRHLLGLNLGRWDYMASLIHYNLANPEWVLPDRNTIPHDVAFFQNLRNLLPEVCHKHGLLAIGGMTALYPSREDPELNARALRVLEEDKRNEADSLMDGAWTGHPDQNEIAVMRFPYPNQLQQRKPNAERRPDLRPPPRGVGKISLAGTRAAVRTVIRYRNGVLNGKGASLLDGYMEDLATDRIYRLMIAQRMRHSGTVPVLDEAGAAVTHDPALITRLFDEELERILGELPGGAGDSAVETCGEARMQSERMIVRGEFDPV